MPEPVTATVPDKGVISRAIGIIVSPGETYATVTAYPRPATILLLACLVLGVASAAPLFTEHGRQMMLDAQVQGIEKITHQPVTPAAYAAMANGARFLPYTTLGSIFITVPIICLLIAAVLWVIFNAIMGGTATFKQVLAIVTHSQVIVALGAVAAAPIVWVKGVQSFAGPFNLGALAPMLDPASPVATFLGGISFFSLWQLVVTAIGLGVLYRRKSLGIAIFLIAAFLLLAAGATAALSSLTSR